MIRILIKESTYLILDNCRSFNFGWLWNILEIVVERLGFIHDDKMFEKWRRKMLSMRHNVHSILIKRLFTMRFLHTRAVRPLRLRAACMHSLEALIHPRKIIRLLAESIIDSRGGAVKGS